MAVMVVIFFCAILFFIALRSPRAGVMAAVFLAPWMGLDADIGLRVTGYRLAIVALVVALFLRRLGTSRLQRKISINNMWLTAFITYALFISVYQMGFLPSLSLESGFLRSGLLRSISQIVMFGLTVAPIFLLPRFVHTSKEIIQCGKVYLWSVTILAVLGWFQLLIWYGTGTDPFPIGLVGSLVSGSAQPLRSGIDHVGSVSIYRMCSFAGEPKGLAQGLAVGLLMLQAGITKVNPASFSKRKALQLWVFLMLSLLLTWSTSGVFLWLIGTVTITLVEAGGLAKKQNRKVFITGLAVLVLVATTIVVVSSDTDSTGSKGVFSTLITKRFVERDAIEDFDEVVLSFLIDQPGYLFTGTGLGNVHVYAKGYIPPYAMYYMAGNVFVAKSGYLRIVSELGVIGLLFFTLSVIRLLSFVRMATKRAPRHSVAQILGQILFVVGIVSFVGGLARTYIWPQMFMILGLCTVYPIIALKGKNRKVPQTTYAHQQVAQSTVMANCHVGKSG